MFCIANDDDYQGMTYLKMISFLTDQSESSIPDSCVIICDSESWLYILSYISGNY